MLFRSTGETYVLYGKTGWYYNETDINIGWYVGWVATRTEAQSDTYVFAFNMDMPDGSERHKRKAVTIEALKVAGALPNNF